MISKTHTKRKMTRKNNLTVIRDAGGLGGLAQAMLTCCLGCPCRLHFFLQKEIEDFKTGLRNQLVMKTLVLLKLGKLIHTICIDGVIVLIAMASTVEKATLFIRKLLLNCSFFTRGCNYHFYTWKCNFEG